MRLRAVTSLARKDPSGKGEPEKNCAATNVLSRRPLSRRSRQRRTRLGFVMCPRSKQTRKLFTESPLCDAIADNHAEFVTTRAPGFSRPPPRHRRRECLATFSKLRQSCSEHCRLDNAVLHKWAKRYYTASTRDQRLLMHRRVVCS